MADGENPLVERVETTRFDSPGHCAVGEPTRPEIVEVDDTELHAGEPRHPLIRPSDT